MIFTSTPRQMEGYWLNSYFPNMLKRSARKMPTYANMETVMLKTGFEIVQAEKYFVMDELKDRFLYSGKNSPHLYLDKHFRNGISSFSELCPPDELHSGLHKLERDVGSGKIKKIISQYENQQGDYLFLVGQKRNVQASL